METAWCCGRRQGDAEPLGLWVSEREKQRGWDDLREKAELMKKPQEMKSIAGKDRGRGESSGKKHRGPSPKQDLLLWHRKKPCPGSMYQLLFCHCGKTPSPKTTYGTKTIYFGWPFQRRKSPSWQRDMAASHDAEAGSLRVHTSTISLEQRD